jgi:diadenosine tetraphosphatase ApaH/serine/threonine PP2A family protein phosphatase
LRLALLADVHSNLEALSACLDHARANGAERYAFLGDLVGYGADPVAVTDVIAGMADDGALVVRGNHDEAAADEARTEGMNGAAAEAARWTSRVLSAERRRWLAELPLTRREGEALLVHGSASGPDQFTYITDPRAAGMSFLAAGDATYVFCGHVHEPVLYHLGASARPQPFRPVPGVEIPVPRHRRWLAVVGSVGQPRDGNTAAAYALVDLSRRTLTFHRIPYDWAGAAQKILDAGLPPRLAVRLQKGE